MSLTLSDWLHGEDRKRKLNGSAFQSKGATHLGSSEGDLVSPAPSLYNFSDSESDGTEDGHFVEDFELDFETSVQPPPPLKSEETQEDDDADTSLTLTMATLMQHEETVSAVAKNRWIVVEDGEDGEDELNDEARSESINSSESYEMC
ncbi:hypothetical protein TrVE_jg14219 [Triparma verrucosa]|uniref:Uncharacterized protein n=2 Tax=Triparma TaxID=722752 RepID=A0A9W7AGM5_9STRA|nr:hypothetical protein TrST_g4879 [Triparma strigata]GMH85105.1 hypothetical protein TrVE_jg14219 [Triparma verrucosa]